MSQNNVKEVSQREYLRRIKAVILRYFEKCRKTNKLQIMKYNKPTETKVTLTEIKETIKLAHNHMYLNRPSPMSFQDKQGQPLQRFQECHTRI